MSGPRLYPVDDYAQEQVCWPVPLRGGSPNNNLFRFTVGVVAFASASVLILLPCGADDRKMVPAEHRLQVLLPDEPRNQGGAHRYEPHAFLRPSAVSQHQDTTVSSSIYSSLSVPRVINRGGKHTTNVSTFSIPTTCVKLDVCILKNRKEPGQ